MSFALAAEECLRNIDAPARPGGRTADLGADEDATREVGRIRCELAYTDPDDLAADVGPTVERLQAACAEASELVDPALLPPGQLDRVARRDGVVTARAASPEDGS